MSDEGAWNPTPPGWTPTPAKTPKPREQVCAFVLSNHRRYSIELVDDGPYGVDAQVWRDEEFSYSIRFPNRDFAVAWATLERELIERKGG